MTERPDTVYAFTDGGAMGNPGPGGYGVILRYQGHERELSAGFRHTTNNRMELMGAITALESLKRGCKVILGTDSRYVVDGICKGWARRWKKNGWMRNKKDKAINPDLWDRLLAAIERHEVTFHWVRGHAGHVENERCDELVQEATRGADLDADVEYERLNGRRSPRKSHGSSGVPGYR